MRSTNELNYVYDIPRTNWLAKDFLDLSIYMTFIKSLASEQSRDITFADLVPWFQIQSLTLTQTLTSSNTPNYTPTLTRFDPNYNPTEKIKNEAFFPFSRALVT